MGASGDGFRVVERAHDDAKAREPSMYPWKRGDLRVTLEGVPIGPKMSLHDVYVVTTWLNEAYRELMAGLEVWEARHGERKRCGAP